MKYVVLVGVLGVLVTGLGWFTWSGQSTQSQSLLSQRGREFLETHRSDNQGLGVAGERLLAGNTTVDSQQSVMDTPCATLKLTLTHTYPKTGNDQTPCFMRANLHSPAMILTVSTATASGELADSTGVQMRLTRSQDYQELKIDQANWPQSYVFRHAQGLDFFWQTQAWRVTVSFSDTPAKDEVLIAHLNQILEELALK